MRLLDLRSGLAEHAREVVRGATAAWDAAFWVVRMGISDTFSDLVSAQLVGDLEQ